jgi:hypothetical protein
MAIRLLAACYISLGEMHNLPGGMAYIRTSHTLGINNHHWGYHYTVPPIDTVPIRNHHHRWGYHFLFHPTTSDRYSSIDFLSFS